MEAKLYDSVRLFAIWLAGMSVRVSRIISTKNTKHKEYTHDTVRHTIFCENGPTTTGLCSNPCVRLALSPTAAVYFTITLKHIPLFLASFSGSRQMLLESEKLLEVSG